MNNTTKYTVALLGILFFSTVAGATCKLESEIPSSTPNSRFTTHPNGTVTDNTTNLMWAKCALGLTGDTCLTGGATSTNWQGALQAAESSALATYTDWRLPNIKELRSIVEKRCYSPSINLTIFPNTPASSFWSASPDAASPARAWEVYFVKGSSDRGDRDYGEHVRLVRSGQ